MSDTADIRAIIALRIRKAREMSGLSQGQAAKMLGLHRPSVTEAEAGNRKVSAEEIAKFADLYKVDASWLLGEGEDQIDPQDSKLQLAAREMKKLKPEDLDTVLAVIASIRGGRK
ncbi:helix-turn-helix domain-containing protein [Pantanalinema rosaneae]|uniref:helix-turn-helix domain-containing protein n=1 Tax=Pantanalinema rosaneae TaxID=1620701 RepID=UPI003D6FBB18